MKVEMSIKRAFQVVVLALTLAMHWMVPAQGAPPQGGSNLSQRVNALEAAVANRATGLRPRSCRAY